MTQLSVQTESDLISINLGSLVNKPTDEEFYAFCRANPELRIEQTKQGDVPTPKPATKILSSPEN